MRCEAEAFRKVLVVEHDPNVQLRCEQAMQLAGIEMLAAASPERAKALLQPNFCGVVVTDIRLPGMDGLQFLQFARGIDADLPVIMIANHDDVALAVEAMGGGAYDFIEKPFSPKHLVEVVKRALEKRRLTREVQSLRHRLHQSHHITARLIGDSGQMEKIRRLILDVANANVDVLVIGEAGTGKATVARCLHDVSRPGGNFVALNCGVRPATILEGALFGGDPDTLAAMRKRQHGKIDCANYGTLFLDEIEALPFSTQIKLLRVLQDRTIDGSGSGATVPVSQRVVAASKVDLGALVVSDMFRSDLYDRLNVVTMQLPPLRERREDIPALYDHFLLIAAKCYGKPAPKVSRDEVRQLCAHDWPGNIHELRKHADCQVLGIAHNSGGTDEASPQAALRLTEAVETFERALIAAELERQSGNVARSSEALGVARTTLHDKIRKYGLN